MYRLCFYLTIFGLSLSALRANPADSLAAPLRSGNGDVGSFWAMAQLGGGIGYIIMAVLALGLFLILFKGINLYIDKRNSRSLIGAGFAGMSLPAIMELTRESAQTIAGNTLRHLIEFHRAGGHAESMHNELVFYVDQENEKFETYRSWLNFLSDSAGALGLLGTVWGVFLTFFGGNLDSEKILNGMGIALITTLLGLVVSLVLNLFNTQIYGIFQRRLEMVTRKADELRLILLQHSTPAAPAEAAPRAAEPASPAPPAKPPAAPVESRPPRLSILGVPARGLAAGEMKKGAIRLQAHQPDGTPLAKATVQVQAEGPLQIDGRNGRAEVVTDKNGLALVDVQGGETAGKGRIRLQLAGAEASETVDLTVHPAEPAQLAVLGGSDQAGQINTVLAEPLRLMVTDRFGNPVTDAPVNFKLTMGSGKFPDGKPQFIARSDAAGMVEARLRLGDKTGFHVVEAALNGRKPVVEFRLLSKS